MAMPTIDLAMPRSSARPGQRRGLIVIAALLLLALQSIPLFTTGLPPLFDYPNHLACFAILSQGGSEFYEVRWALLPNLEGDLIVPLLARAIPLEIAGKLFLVMIFALMLGGTVWLNRMLTGEWRFWPLLVTAFLYNLQILWGFINYLFGLGVAICGAALWLALERQPIWLRIAASAVIALVCFLSHIAACGFYALLVCGLELQPGFAELRNKKWTALGRRAGILAAQFLVPVAFLLLFWHPVADHGISYDELSSKARWLYGALYNYVPAFDLTCTLLLVISLGALAWQRRLNVAPRAAPAILLGLLAYLLSPSEILSAWGADQRLVIGFFLLLVAAAGPRFPSSRVAYGIGAVITLVIVTRLCIVEAFWSEADAVYRADLAGIDLLPRNIKLAVAYPGRAFIAGGIPEVHLATLAVIRRHAFVATVFAFSDQQPIALKPAYAGLAAVANPYALWPAFMVGDDAARRHTLAALAGYDAIVFVDREPFQLPSEECLKPLFWRPTFQIFTFEHGGGCPEAR